MSTRPRWVYGVGGYPSDSMCLIRGQDLICTCPIVSLTMIPYARLGVGSYFLEVYLRIRFRRVMQWSSTNRSASSIRPTSTNGPYHRMPRAEQRRRLNVTYRSKRAIAPCQRHGLKDHPRIRRRFMQHWVNRIIHIKFPPIWSLIVVKAHKS